jgi:outer membrane protein
MKRNICLLGGIIFLLFVWSTNSWAADKIGFINMMEIIQNSTEGKKAREDLKEVTEMKQASISSVEKELKEMKDELDSQGSTLTASVRRDKVAAYQKKLRDYQLLVKDANEELKRRDLELSQKLLPGIVKIVRAIAEKEKYTLVIDIASMPVPYYTKENDFSKKVIEEYNKSK